MPNWYTDTQERLQGQGNSAASALTYQYYCKQARLQVELSCSSHQKRTPLLVRVAGDDNVNWL